MLGELTIDEPGGYDEDYIQLQHTSRNSQSAVSIFGRDEDGETVIILTRSEAKKVIDWLDQWMRETKDAD